VTLGNAAAAMVRLIVWCRDCGRQVEPDPGEMAERYGAETTVIDGHARLTCSGCGSRQVDFVVTRTERSPCGNSRCRVLLKVHHHPDDPPSDIMDLLTTVHGLRGERNENRSR
jgi:hypothetical protein